MAFLTNEVTTNGGITRNGKNDSTDLLALALDIVKHTASMLNLLAAQDHPGPNFSVDSPELPDTPEHGALRSKLLASLDDLRMLVEGPRTTMRSLMGMSNDLAALQVAFDFGFFKIVPVTDRQGMAVEEIARRASIDVGRTRQVMRFLCTHRIFKEIKDGYFAHTASSAAFGQDENLIGLGQYSTDDMFKAASSTADTIRASPQTSDLVHSPFAKRLGANMFDFYRTKPEYAARFAKAMAGVTTIDRKPGTLADAFPWQTLQGIVVDVGGGSGHVSMALASRFPNLSFRVQDSEEMLAEGRRSLKLKSETVAGRIAFERHDFFQPQRAGDKGIAAYFLRHVFHNWADEDAITILRALLPGLETSPAGTPILISDRVLPCLEDNVPLHLERAMRRQDMMMLVGLGAKERTRGEWESLLRAADERLKLKEIHAHGQSALLEVRLTR